MNQQTEILTLSRPCRLYINHDWPAGHQRVTREFAIQVDDSGRERALTWTIGKPKKSPWSSKCRIVHGSDGRTYVVSLWQRTATLFDANMKQIDICKNGELFRVVYNLLTP